MVNLYISSLYDGEPPYEGHLASLISGLAKNHLFHCSLNQADSALLLDYQPQKLRSLIGRGIPRNRRFLVIREPQQVHPSAYKDKYLGQFGKVFRMGHCLSEKVEYPWAYDEPKGWEKYFSRKERNHSVAVAVASWRFSLIKGSYYQLRNEIYRLQNIHLYGFGWDDDWIKKAKEVLKQVVTGIKNFKILSPAPLFDANSYKVMGLGRVGDKLETLSNYKVSLVIENSGDYFSEKLFDAIYAGCIPVYVGPSIAALGLDSNLVIQAEPNVLSISQGVEKALALPRDEWANNMLSVIRAGKFSDWNSNHSWLKIANVVARELSAPR